MHLTHRFRHPRLLPPTRRHRRHRHRRRPRHRPHRPHLHHLRHRHLPRHGGRPSNLHFEGPHRLQPVSGPAHPFGGTLVWYRYPGV